MIKNKSTLYSNCTKPKIKWHYYIVLHHIDRLKAANWELFKNLKFQTSSSTIPSTLPSLLLSFQKKTPVQN